MLDPERATSSASSEMPCRIYRDRTTSLAADQAQVEAFDFVPSRLDQSVDQAALNSSAVHGDSSSVESMG